MKKPTNWKHHVLLVSRDTKIALHDVSSIFPWSYTCKQHAIDKTWLPGVSYDEVFEVAFQKVQLSCVRLHTFVLPSPHKIQHTELQNWTSFKLAWHRLILWPPTGQSSIMLRVEFWRLCLECANPEALHTGSHSHAVSAKRRQDTAAQSLRQNGI